MTMTERLVAGAARPAVAGVVVFAVALVLRVALWPTARFGGDEALFFQIACDIVELKRWPLLGTQLTDGKALLPGPTFLYLMALPVAVVRRPEAQFLFVEVLGAVTAWLLWHALRRPFGERGALFAGLMFAVSPWAALYADRTWNPNVLPFFVVLALFAVVRLREAPSSRWLALFVPATAILPHFHMSAPVAWAGLLVLAAPTVKRWSRRPLLVGLCIALVLYLPLLVHELSTGFLNIRNIVAETVGGRGGERHPSGFLWVPVYALRFLTLDVTYHELTGYWGGPDEWKNVAAAWSGTPPRPFHPLRVFALAVSLALALWAVGAAIASFLRRGLGSGFGAFGYGAAFVAALVANMALLGLAQKQVFGHYVTNLMPFAFVAYAVLGRGALKRRSTTVALALSFVVFASGGVEATLSVSRRVDARIGLAVHRDVLAAIHADGAAEHTTALPVRLDFGHRDQIWPWWLYSTRALERPIHFDKAAPARRYKLFEPHKRPPSDTAAGWWQARAMGPVVLYRFVPGARPALDGAPGETLR